MKFFRFAALIILFLLGAACLVWYFRTGDTDNTEKKEASGMLLTDTSPLGELSVLSDGTLAAGNAPVPVSSNTAVSPMRVGPAHACGTVKRKPAPLAAAVLFGLG